MSDTEHKWVRTRGIVLHRPAIYPLSGGRSLTRAPAAAVLRAQDSILGRPRMAVAQHHRSGSDEWLVPSSAPAGGGVQTYPTADTWRKVGETTLKLPPGCVLEADILYVPAGLTEVFNSPNWEEDGAQGAFRFQITWDNGTDSETRTFGIEMGGSVESNAGISSGAGEAWSTLEHRTIEDIMPEGAELSAAEQQKWSEWPEVDVVMEQSGGARVLQAILSVRPFAHAQDHDETANVSAHAYTEGGDTPVQLPTEYPQTEAADGGTYEEQRFGSQRLVEVVGEQGEKMGPRLLHGSAYTEQEANVLLTDSSPFVISGSTPVSVYDGSTQYDSDMPGHVIGASYAQLRHISGEIALRGGAAVIPATVWVRGQLADGATLAYFRLQSSDYQWIDVPVTSAALRVWGWTGYLEAQVVPDGFIAQCAALGWVATSGDLKVHDWAVSFGHHI